MLREVAAAGYARSILSVRSRFVAVVTSVTLVFATPAFASPPQTGSAETPPAASHEAASPQRATIESPEIIWPTLRDRPALEVGHLEVQPWDGFKGALAPALPNVGATQTIMSRDTKVVIIVVAVVGGLLLLVLLYYGTRPCCGPHPP